MRISTRRFTWLTNACSRQAGNHVRALALYFTFYNFVRIEKTLRCSTAMAAGISDRLWSMRDVVALIDAAEVPTTGSRTLQVAVFEGGEFKQRRDPQQGSLTPGAPAFYGRRFAGGAAHA